MAAALTVLSVVGCRTASTEPVESIPPPAAYASPSDFAGIWMGEVDGVVGRLDIRALDQGRYRALFEGDEVRLRYVMLLEQAMVEEGTQAMASNRVTFTWQDGHGSRGEGWMLINREDSALTGSSGERGRYNLRWSFIRVE